MPVSSFEKERLEREQARESWHRAAKAVRQSKGRVKQVLSRSLATVRSLFELIDRDGSGTISAEEFHHAVHAMGVPAPREVTDLVFADFDFDGSGEINRHEFIRYILRDALSCSSTRVMDLFKKWDTDGSGELSFQEFQEAILSLGFAVPYHELLHVFEEIDTDKSGTVSFPELHRQLRQGSAIQLAKKLKPGRAGVIELEAKNRAYALRGDLAAQSMAARRPTTGGPATRGLRRESAILPHPTASTGPRATTAPAPQPSGTPHVAVLFDTHLPDAHTPTPGLMAGAPILSQAASTSTLKQPSSRAYLLPPASIGTSNISDIYQGSNQRTSSSMSSVRSVGGLDSLRSSASQNWMSGTAFVVDNRQRREKTQDERAKVATDHRPLAVPVVYRHKLLRGTHQRWVEPLPSISKDKEAIWTLTAFPPPPARPPTRSL